MQCLLSRPAPGLCYRMGAHLRTRSAWALSSHAWRPFGSGHAWSEAEPVASEAYKNGPQQIQFWRNPRGALVAEHDDIEDIEACRWAIQRVCQRVLDFQAGSIGLPAWSRLLVLRFLLDLEDRIEHLSSEGLGTCAVELFERPWVITCNLGQSSGSYSSKTEVLRLRPRPDSWGKRAALAALSPVIAPVGAMVTYVRLGGWNTIAACKWYFRAIAELPCSIALDRSYRLEGSDNDVIKDDALQLDDARRLVRVQGAIPQLGI
jgi:hypothetical protein